jgi:uncharacterized protein
MVKVTEVDIARKRIALSMKTDEKPEPRPRPVVQQPKPQVKKVEFKAEEPETDIAIKLAALKNRFS